MTFPAGTFSLINRSASSTAVIADGQAHGLKMVLAHPQAVDQLLIEVVTTPGGVGSVVRGAFYADDGTGNSTGALISDLGTIATDTTGVKAIAFTALTLPRGTVWAVIAPQGTPAPNPTLRTLTSNNMPMTQPSLSSLAVQFKFVAGITGAFPASLTLTTGNIVGVAMALRAA